MEALQETRQAVSSSDPVPGCIIEPLTDHHNREAFHCGVEALDNYFRRQVSRDVRKGVACAYVLVSPEDRRAVLGFYTLCSTLIPLEGFPSETARRLPRYPNIPATLIGRLAVSAAHRGKRLGEYLLMDALSVSLTQSRKIASAAVVVDAKDETAGAFYRKFGFMPFAGRPARLFLPMKTIARLVALPDPQQP